jgi:hypothetical protein
LIHSKKDLPKLKKFEIKYGFEGFEERNNFLQWNIFKLEKDFELKFWEIKVFYFRKLIKIARNGQKNPGICMKVGNPIWNTSHVGNFF